MPNEIKNRFLVLGLTGPLGSGCTEAARFLSNEGKITATLKSLLDSRISAESIKETAKAIEDCYATIKNNKQRISEERKGILQASGEFVIDPNKVDGLRHISQENDIQHHILKTHLFNREVNKTLESFCHDKCFGYNNLNSDDYSLFGFQPFVYISFTHIIIKLAYERYCQDKLAGNQSMLSYFNDKLASALSDRKPMYENIRDTLLTIFDEEYDQYNDFMRANIWVKSRGYQNIPTQNVLKNLNPQTSETIFKRIQSKAQCFYDYLKFLKLILNRIKNPQDKSSSYTHVLSDVLQDWGDNIRSTGNPFNTIGRYETIYEENLFNIPQEINRIIKFVRHRVRYFDVAFYPKKNNDEDDKLPTLFVLECFRNPYEVEFFRLRYAEFYLLSITADLPVRKRRIGTLYSPVRDRRDQGIDNKTGAVYKLDVTKCVSLSDISIVNNDESSQPLQEKLIHYLALIRSPGCVPPRPNELYMHLAYSLSLMSTCISRKVGAVIVGPSGHVYSAGWNDVGEGQIGCGLRTKNDLKSIEEIPKVSSKYSFEEFNSAASSMPGDYVCYKDCMSKVEVTKKLTERKDKFCEKCIESAKDVLKVKRLEYCRALHAEENALLQISKIGGIPVSGSTIYTTTYPCELCAKKLFQAGIKTIYFTEPYPESISEEVFLEDGVRKIETVPFEGVKSQSFYRLFKPVYDKKDMPFIELLRAP